MKASHERNIGAPQGGGRWEFWLDRGGTFTDIVGRDPDGGVQTTKLLSQSTHYADAAVEGIRRLMGVPAGQPLPVERIAAVKMGTTVATNALLERKGEPTVLVITEGFGDQLRIGYQNRPKLFERHIHLPEVLYSHVIEARERIDARGNVVVPLDEEALEHALQEARVAGWNAVAIVFMHAWHYPGHEQRAAALARRAGFSQVSVSHEVSPLMKLVSRGDTTVVDAYLSPILRRYVDRVTSELRVGNQSVPLYFMKSDGGLTGAAAFQGKDSILSGPAGGIVGMVRTALAAGFSKVIGFDMGGTSTDVSHFAGQSVADCERDYESLVAGVRLRAPMMSIHTVAAGGGSVLHFDGQKYSVGPDSAGAHPGPCCYRRGGPLTLTDCNVMLGRIQPAYFPQVFGPQANEPLDREAVVGKFETLAGEMAKTTGTRPLAEEVAEGFLRIAVTNMANAIKFISVQRGHDVTEYALACFGGAGGQHACRVADELGMTQVYIHALAGVLSAFGMGLAEITAMREHAWECPLGEVTADELEHRFRAVATEAQAEVVAQGLSAECVEILRRVHLRYGGTDTALVVDAADPVAMREAFEVAYKRRFSFLMPDRELIVEALSVEAVGTADAPARPALEAPTAGAEPTASELVYFEGHWVKTPIYARHGLACGGRIRGPAVIVESHATTVVEPGWQAVVTPDNHLLLERYLQRPRTTAVGTKADPVMLEVFNNLFMSIAEQMGVRLANTAYSVNIKERLDFSCALFGADGSLIANAPHMPVHLGSMSESIRTVIRRNQGRVRRGDVYVLNDPYNGGTHLPDVTVVMPIFAEGNAEILFYVAARGHHADVGGLTPGSMPPASRSVEEEGVLIDNFRLVDSDRMRERELRELLTGARYPARNPDQNIADLRAQIAACEKGREELMAMVDRFGLRSVQAYVRHVQESAAESVRRALLALDDGEFAYAMDNGATVRVAVRVDRRARHATVDFTGSSPQLDDNFNAPPAVVRAAVLYVFRTLVDDEIPMNEGCLEPITLILPEGCMLSPQPPAATVAGNVETSQCVTDALYGALGVMAASQGTMNNVTFGNARYQYYETVAGGSGAGDGFDGTAAVQTHMTNSRMTDPEVIEHRFPVRIEEHSIRRGSGGAGRYRGGDGALRRISFLEPMTAAIVAGHRLVPPYGMAGGADGETGRTWIERHDGRHEILPYAAEVTMDVGETFVISTPSGGGFGEPQ